MDAAEPTTLVTLPPMARAVAAAWLQAPWLPATGVAELPQVLAAGGARVPIVLRVPTEVQRTRFVRALAAAAGYAEGAVVWDADAPPPAAPVVLAAPDTWTAARWLRVACAVDDATSWLLIAVPFEMELPDAVAALASCTLTLPRLTMRRADLLALAEAQLARLANRAGCPTPSLTAGAQAALAQHTWPKDQPELEAVLTRAFVRERSVIDADHLDLGAAVVTAPLTTPADMPPAPPAATPTSDAHLEFLLAELAHEIRNPLVTIKTFAHHLPSLLDDEPLRERFRALTDEAIERMEAVLDNVLDYGRLGPPTPAALDIPPLLDRILADASPELRSRGIVAQRTGASHATCAGDAEHVTYALRNLITGVVREMPAGEPLVLDASANGVVRVQFAAGGTAATRLRALAAPIDHDPLRDPTLLPLSFTLARAVLDAAGGTLGIETEAAGATTLVVQLPVMTR